ncbi:MAG TPA: tripartite tricarboxylate transporter substrate binding protein [Burkholderiales bacterium]|nr:tripartite tricarboxylate transporter substrate binding protein [Burkholderiales bacterium]
MFTYSRLLSLIAVLLAVLTAGYAAAQAYPARPLRMIVPYPPGGSTDPTGRLFAAWFSEKLGQQVVVDNRPGAGATIGHGLAAKATPDGYTILFATSGGLVTGPIFNANVPYDSLKDFSPIGLIAYNPFLLVTHPSLPAADLKAFLDDAKARPGKINFASPGVGTPNHLGIELLTAMTGMKFVHVPYKGGGPAMLDMLAGRAQAIFSGVPQCIVPVRAGRLKAIATGHPTRLSVASDAAPIADTLPGFNNTTFFAFVAPAGTPRKIVERLSTETRKAIADPEFNKRLVDLGVVPVSSTPDGLHDMIRTEIKRWRKVINDAGITAAAGS